MPSDNKRNIDTVRHYWQTHTLGKQFVFDQELEVGSKEFFDHIRPWMTPYRFKEIRDRIEREAPKLKGRRLLEIECGMGFDSIEFLKRGVHVVSTDLTPAAVELAKRNIELNNMKAEDVRVENVLSLSFEDNSFDAVWACGVLHHTGDTPKAIKEIRRVLKPGGRAVISHFYRKPSWMYYLSRFGRENIEFKDEDAPITDFFTEKEIFSMFEGFKIEEAVQEHYRVLPTARKGYKANIYTWIFLPLYNLLPESLAKHFAYKFSVTAIKI